ncbi:hypothetical protein [Pseudomonas phage Hadban]|nr:hypothetical protein [Pseudomonas phage Hadban]
MSDQPPLNPDALARHQWAHDFNSCDCGKSIPTIIDSENCVYVPNDKAMAKHQIEMATVAQPESNPDTREQRIALGRLLKKALRQCGISMTYALSGPGELYDVAGILLREYPTLAVAQPVVKIFEPRELNRKGWTCGCEPGNYDSCDECQWACNVLSSFLNRPEVNDD